MSVPTSAYIQMLVVALLTIAEGWTQLRCLLANEQANNTGISIQWSIIWSRKQRSTTVTYYSVDELWEYHTKQKKPGANGHFLKDSIDMKCPGAPGCTSVQIQVLPVSTVRQFVTQGMGSDCLGTYPGSSTYLLL